MQTEYTVPSIEEIASHDLVIHTKNQRNNKIVIFIHGLGGSRYGKKSTWKNFPKYLFEDLAKYDIGLYEYATFTKRLRKPSLTIEDEADNLAHIIRDSLKNYSDIIFLGHSLGGILAKATIAKLIFNNDINTLSRIKGLFLLATPNTGSKWNVPLLMNAFEDFKVLAKENNKVLEINKALANYFVFDENISLHGKNNLPSWAVIASNDWWVDRLSAEICFSSDRKKLVKGTHTSIVKPNDKSDDVYKWVKDKILLCNEQYEYDLYISFPMSSYANPEDYKVNRHILSNFVEKLKDILGLDKIYCEGLNIEDSYGFEVPKTSLSKSLNKIVNSKYYMLLMFENIKSSVTFEAGYAMALNKKSTYFVYDTVNNLPYTMRGMKGQIFTFKTNDDLLRIVENEKENILEIKEEML